VSPQPPPCGGHAKQDGDPTSSLGRRFKISSRNMGTCTSSRSYLYEPMVANLLPGDLGKPGLIATSSLRLSPPQIGGGHLLPATTDENSDRNAAPPPVAVLTGPPATNLLPGWSRGLRPGRRATSSLRRGPLQIGGSHLLPAATDLTRYGRCNSSRSKPGQLDAATSSLRQWRLMRP
jgi:hypothetical protein